MKFNLGDSVRIAAGTESGKIFGRSEHVTSEPQYFVRYVAADGRATEQWWTESALELLTAEG